MSPIFNIFLFLGPGSARASVASNKIKWNNTQCCKINYQPSHEPPKPKSLHLLHFLLIRVGLKPWYCTLNRYVPESRTTRHGTFASFTGAFPFSFFFHQQKPRKGSSNKCLWDPQSDQMIRSKHCIWWAFCRVYQLIYSIHRYISLPQPQGPWWSVKLVLI